MEKKNSVKNSVIISGLIGTGGLFVAKLLGLVYSIPFSSILGSEAIWDIMDRLTIFIHMS